MHDPTKQLMGSTPSSCREGVIPYDVDPTTFIAGLAVRLASTGLPSVAKAAGMYLGVTLGKNLSATAKHTSVVKAGLKVPMLLEASPAKGSATITSFANLVSGTADTITVGATVFTAQAGAVTPGGATFQAATSNNATATSLAAQINAHATASTLVKATANNAVVTITAKLNTSAGNSIALAYADNGTSTVGATVSGATLTGGGTASDFVVKGAKVYISDTTGKADDPNSDATISDAVYASGILTGIQEDGTTAACVLVDMQGGL